MSDHTRTADLMARLERHYIKPSDPLPGGIFVPECGLNGTTGRRVDAIYVGFTSASGRRLIGHEVKVSRADWRHELDTVGKADTWADECHAWYVVAPDTTIVPPEELPDAWGLMVINPRTTTRLKVVKPATIHTDRRPSWQVVRSIMARQDTLRAAAIDRARRTIEEAAYAKAEQTVAARQIGGRRLTRAEEERLGLLDRLEDKLGYRLDGWAEDDPKVTPERLAAAIAVCKAGGIDLPRYQRDQIDRTLKVVTAGFAELGKALDEWHAVAGERR